MSEKSNSLLIGAHTSASGGCFNALYEGGQIGATTIQLFTANQKQWTPKGIDESAVKKWEDALIETKLSHIMSHDSYLINLGSPREEVLEKSKKAFLEEIERCKTLGITYLNFHPGAALDGGEDACIQRIIDSLKEVSPLASQKGAPRLLLEATAGQGSTVGYTFEHLRDILQEAKESVPLGVCIDTCHIFAAGYDIRTKKALESTLQQFDHIVGLEHLYALHLNDSKKELGSRVDRHANLGEGFIGMDAFIEIVRNDVLKKLPLYLETPGGVETWRKEIQFLKQHTR